MESKKLGKGLDFLIKKTSPPLAAAKDEARPPASARSVPVEAIDPNPFQPRREFDIDGLNELIESIRLHGVLQPVALRDVGGGRYQLVAGERRWRASRELGLEEIPAIVHDLDDRRMLEVALIENIQREDLTPIEKAKAYRRLMTEFSLTQEEASRQLSQKRSTVANYLRLLELPSPVQDLVAGGQVSMGHARALAGVADPARQIAWAEEAARGALNVRSLEKRVRALKKKTAAHPVAPPEVGPADAQAVEIERRLREALATKVSVRGRGRGGRLTIEYYDAAALQRILGCIEAGAEAQGLEAAR